jgi:hypothetical protein
VLAQVGTVLPLIPVKAQIAHNVTVVIL